MNTEHPEPGPGSIHTPLPRWAAELLAPIVLALSDGAKFDTETRVVVCLATGDCERPPFTLASMAGPAGAAVDVGTPEGLHRGVRQLGALGAAIGHLFAVVDQLVPQLVQGLIKQEPVLNEDPVALANRRRAYAEQYVAILRQAIQMIQRAPFAYEGTPKDFIQDYVRWTEGGREGGEL